MISNIFRKLIECLSFFYKNNLKLVKKNDPIILKTIKKKLNTLSFETKNLLIFPLNFSRVKHTPEHDIEEPISFFLKVILDFISSIQLLLFL